MNKLYNRIIFANGTTPALNETNLNAISKAIDDIDDRVVAIADDVLEDIPEIKELLPEVEEALEEANAKLPTMKGYADSAKASADDAEEWADKAEEWAKTAQTTSVVVTPNATSGQLVGTITVNGSATSLYCTGGGGGASSYSELTDKPQINSVELSGNKTLADLGIASASDLSDLADLVGQANAILEEV